MRSLIAIGYILFFAYTIGIMGLGILLEKKTSLDKTICRKITHIISAFLWIICYHFFGCSLHWVILNVFGAIILGVVTLNKRFAAFQRSDTAKNPGVFYFGLATAVVAVFCYLVGEELYLYTGLCYFALALGDGLAPIASGIAGRHNRDICPGKTLVGTATVFVMSFASVLGFSLIFSMDLDLIFILSVAALTCIAEFYGFRGTDNLLIEFLVFGYLVLFHYGLVELPLQIVIILSPGLAVLAVGKGAMERSAGFVAFFLFALVGFLGENFVPMIFLCSLFGASMIISSVGKRVERRRHTYSKEYRPRQARQIIAVCFFAIIFLVLYRITGKAVFYYLFFLSLTEQLADSVASDIGRLTQKQNVDIITRMPVEKGVSGGISALGTGFAFVSSCLFMCIPLLMGVVTWRAYILTVLIAFAGTLVDSVVGSQLQALYECPVCRHRIERKTCCGQTATLIKGHPIVDNVAVNYIAGAITCLLGAVLIFIK